MLGYVRSSARVSGGGLGDRWNVLGVIVLINKIWERATDLDLPYVA